MGQRYELKCAACAYGISVTEGVGMAYWPEAVFYGCGEDVKPLLLSLVDSERIKEIALGLISNGATPGREYGHELYACPNCNRLANQFYFKLTSPTDNYEPDYYCSSCSKQLLRVELERGDDDLISHDNQTRIVYKDHRRLRWKCPECGCEDLIYRAVADWD